MGTRGTTVHKRRDAGFTLMELLVVMSIICLTMSITLPSLTATDWGRGKLIRRVQDKNWVPADSKEGRKIFEDAFAPNADGERPIYCRPE